MIVVSLLECGGSLGVIKVVAEACACREVRYMWVGHWTGIVGDSVYRHANFSFCLNMNLERLKVIDFSRVYYYDALTFVTGKTRPTSLWKKLITPFTTPTPRATQLHAHVPNNYLLYVLRYSTLTYLLYVLRYSSLTYPTTTQSTCYAPLRSCKLQQPPPPATLRYDLSKTPIITCNPPVINFSLYTFPVPRFPSNNDLDPPSPTYSAHTPILCSTSVSPFTVPFSLFRSPLLILPILPPFLTPVAILFLTQSTSLFNTSTCPYTRPTHHFPSALALPQVLVEVKDPRPRNTYHNPFFTHTFTLRHGYPYRHHTLLSQRVSPTRLYLSSTRHCPTRYYTSSLRSSI
ncbi:hypothetical protein Pcinc_003194 [Petrolisthes cinctipes]|uniref:Uncharacterized protein n=1 Tax=Petrolisthes cinctipes TaxID=88211 RepID=A0AAE1GJF6_PETCI|nr:hypothetical protein Pcinc_003194 [Petrolisthes cinctipes]